MMAQPGYPGLARRMTAAPGMAIFKKFEELSIQNLLYMQAEILHLEFDFETFNLRSPITSSLDRPPVSAGGLSQEEAERHHSEGRAKVANIREKLREYHDTLLQQAQVFALRPARIHDLELVKEWLNGPNAGVDFPNPIEALPYEKGLDDLVALSGIWDFSWDFDSFSIFLSQKILPFLYERFYLPIKRLTLSKTQDPGTADQTTIDPEVRNINDDCFRTLAKVLSVLLATLLPSMAVVALYFIPNLLARLGAIFGFSFLFAISMAYFTTAKPAEIFAITAACASVQVVFVGSTSTLKDHCQCAT